MYRVLCFLLVTILHLHHTAQATLIQVPRKKWKSKTTSFILPAAKLGLPQIFTNPPALRKWRAFKKWSFQENGRLATIVDTLNGIYLQHDSPVFGPFFDTSRPLATHPDITPTHHYTQISMPMSKFLSNLSTPTTPPTTPPTFMYLTREIERVHPLLEHDISPFHELIRLGPQKSSINIWMGQQGVIAPCHYDSYHNVYVQVYGQKTFFIASPTAKHILKPYPFVHPSHAQCQLRLNAERAAQIDVYVATLHKGDVLYLPPLWFHEVVAETNSISVNGWTPGRDAVWVDALFAVPLPTVWMQLFQMQTTKRTLQQRVVLLSTMLVALFAQVKDVRAVLFLSELYTTRFQSLHRVFSVTLPWVEFDCLEWRNKEGEQKEQVDVWRWAAEVAQVVGHFQKNTGSIWLGNYVETMCLTIVGGENAHELGALLKGVRRCVGRLRSGDVGSGRRIDL